VGRGCACHCQPVRFNALGTDTHQLFGISLRSTSRYTLLIGLFKVPLYKTDPNYWWTIITTPTLRPHLNQYLLPIFDIVLIVKTKRKFQNPSPEKKFYKRSIK
jgi:hypothetical protein